MASNLTASESGCLLLADITGYTAYLQATELEHAQDVLADLLENLVGTLEPVFKLSKLEGDAAFAYVPDSGASATMIMDTVEAGYFAFRMRLRDIVHSTTCDCNACVLIPQLDLKYFIHRGEFVARRIAGTEELTGPDVILVHRLMKGTAGSVIGKPAYAVYTSATLQSLGMNPEMLRFLPHTEEFDDIGEVEVFVQDLDMQWAFEQERHREYVTTDEAEYETKWDVPVPPAVLWDYITDPAKRVRWQTGITSFETVTPGRLGVGSVNHCMHGEDRIIEHVADWRPFEYLTLDYPNPAHDGTFRLFFQFQSIDDRTLVTFRIGPMTSDMKVWWEDVKEQWLAQSEKDGQRLVEVIMSDLAPAQV